MQPDAEPTPETVCLRQTDTSTRSPDDVPLFRDLTQVVERDMARIHRAEPE